MIFIKNPPAYAGDIRDADLIPGSGRSSGEGMATHCSILAGESHEWRSLASYSPLGCTEPDLTEAT